MTQQLSAKLGHSHAQTPQSSFSPNNSNGSLDSNILTHATNTLAGMKISADDRIRDTPVQTYVQDDETQVELDSEPWQDRLEEMDSVIYDAGDLSHTQQYRGQLKTVDSVLDGSPSLSTECSSPSTPNEITNSQSGSRLSSSRGKTVSMPPLRITSSSIASLPTEARHSEGYERDRDSSRRDSLAYGSSLLGLQLNAGPSRGSQTLPLLSEHSPQPPLSSPTTSFHSSLAAAERSSLSASIPSIAVTPTSPRSHAPSAQQTHNDQVENSYLRAAPNPLADPVRSTAPLADWHHGRRRTTEHRGGNRLSGFFQHLLHLRDRDHTVASGSSVHEPTPQATETLQVETPVIPPPQLPPPTLSELGLAMTSITPYLLPSQFPNPPTSGVFLAPHYLLLCHSQGLDVLPLVSPPVQQPYALVRRVAFKAVLVMEQRSVMIAIAGRREGVRVYALEEVRRAVEWRVEVEVERERDKAAKERGHKRSAAGLLTDQVEYSSESKTLIGHVGLVQPPKVNHPQAQTPPATVEASQPVSPPPLYSTLNQPGGRLATRVSTSSMTLPPHTGPNRDRGTSVSTLIPPSGMAADTRGLYEKREWIENRESDDEALDPVAAGQSGSAALDERTSAALTASSSATSGRPLTTRTEPGVQNGSTQYSNPHRRARPGNLELSTNSIIEPTIRPPASPAPTLMSLRQALGSNTQTLTPRPPRASTSIDDAPDTPIEGADVISFAQALIESRLPTAPLPPTPSTPFANQPRPHLHRQNSPSTPRTMQGYTTDTSQPDSPSTAHPGSRSRISRTNTSSDRRRRRRWSVLDSVFKQPGFPARNVPPIPTSASTTNIPATTTPDSQSGDEAILRRTPRSFTTPAFADSIGRASSASIPTSLSNVLASTSQPRIPIARTVDRIFQPQTDPDAPATSPIVMASPEVVTQPGNPLLPRPPPTPRTRFLPRWFGALTSSRAQPPHQQTQPNESATSVKPPDDQDRRSDFSTPTAVHAPAPKLEYVKLPGTKGALTIKAVETPKKSFLAILCGDAGEKVELFAGTYRTALGLSRTFILPDSPRSLELQLQGDDLVELFLVFGQNVFGLEPATVRVREVRIGRAERRAARRRAREARTVSVVPDAATSLDDVLASGETVVTTVVSVGEDPNDSPRDSAGDRRSTSIARPRRSVAGYVTSSGVNGSSLVTTERERERDRDAFNDGTVTPSTPNNISDSAQVPEELAALAAVAQLGPYTTFQQLSFAPTFPLGTIADDYIIPPTYTEFLDYRSRNEPQATPIPELLTAPDAPATLDLPITLTLQAHSDPTPSKWLYIDPKGVVRGPWKASLMRSWYDDGFLPPDLPVRKDTESEYTLLKDLCFQALDPEHPFFPYEDEPPSSTGVIFAKPLVLLQPTSLLVQPQHFGPPALFFCSRGGHSTTIVDSRGRSVLRGRLNWTADDQNGKLGDIRRLEAFDTDGRTVVVAIRQGAIEVVDVGDALLRPADQSRSYLPHFNATPEGISRRPAYTWRLGTITDPSDAANPPESPPPKGSTNKRFAALSLKAGSVHTPMARAPPKADAIGAAEGDVSLAEEILWLGRNQNTIYFCERTVSSFRILSLSTSS